MAGLKIDLYAQDGSPLNISPDLIYERGVGGAELSMMTWARTMAERGHSIRVYNNPPVAKDYDGVNYLPQSDLVPGEKRDVFIAFRSPNPHLKTVKAGLKVHWSMDQYTIGDYARDIVPFVDRIVCISSYHRDYYQKRYLPSPDQITHIDLGVRVEDYQRNIDKVQYRFIYCSQPRRGLDIVHSMWGRIREALPQATLVITADERLWGAYNPNNHQFRMQFLHQEGVIYRGAIRRPELIQHQQQAQIHLFPCTYEELFCISSAECQVAGAYSVTSDAAALMTTNEFGCIVPGNPYDLAWQKTYLEAVIGLMQDQARLTTLAEAGMDRARARFDWHKICEEWERLIVDG